MYASPGARTTRMIWLRAQGTDCESSSLHNDKDCTPISWVEVCRHNWRVEPYHGFPLGRIGVGRQIPHTNIPVLASREDVSRIPREAEHTRCVSKIDSGVVQDDALHGSHAFDMSLEPPYSRLGIQVPYTRRAIIRACAYKPSRWVKLCECGL